MLPRTKETVKQIDSQNGVARDHNSGLQLRQAKKLHLTLEETSAVLQRMRELRNEADSVGSLLEIVEKSKDLVYNSDQSDYAEKIVKADSCIQYIQLCGREAASLLQSSPIKEMVNRLAIDLKDVIQQLKHGFVKASQQTRRLESALNRLLQNKTESILTSQAVRLKDQHKQFIEEKISDDRMLESMQTTLSESHEILGCHSPQAMKLQKAMEPLTSEKNLLTTRMASVQEEVDSIEGLLLIVKRIRELMAEQDAKEMRLDHITLVEKCVTLLQHHHMKPAHPLCLAERDICERAIESFGSLLGRTKESIIQAVESKEDLKRLEDELKSVLSEESCFTLFAEELGSLLADMVSNKGKKTRHEADMATALNKEKESQDDQHSGFQAKMTNLGTALDMVTHRFKKCENTNSNLTTESQTLTANLECEKREEMRLENKLNRMMKMPKAQTLCFTPPCVMPPPSIDLESPVMHVDTSSSMKQLTFQLERLHQTQLNLEAKIQDQKDKEMRILSHIKRLMHTIRRRRPTRSVKSKHEAPTFASMRRRRCYRCGEKGHLARDCPNEEARSVVSGSEESDDFPDRRLRTEEAFKPKEDFLSDRQGEWPSPLGSSKSSEAASLPLSRLGEGESMIETLSHPASPNESAFLHKQDGTEEESVSYGESLLDDVVRCTNPARQIPDNYDATADPNSQQDLYLLSLDEDFIDPKDYRRERDCIDPLESIPIETTSQCINFIPSRQDHDDFFTEDVSLDDGID